MTITVLHASSRPALAKQRAPLTALMFVMRTAVIWTRALAARHVQIAADATAAAHGAVDVLTASRTCVAAAIVTVAADGAVVAAPAAATPVAQAAIK